MARWLLYRFRTAILVLALGIGLSPGLSPSSASASAIAGQMALADAGTAIPDHCDGCAEDGGASQDACIVACVSAAGPVILPATAVVVMPRPAAFTAPAPLGGSGRLGPPDPHPPRPSALG